MTVRDVKVPSARWIVGAVAVVVSLGILYLGRNFTFLYDEWIFITTLPGWTLKTYFEPHNEHPVMLLRVFYAVFLNVFGLRSYVPYLAALLTVHAVNVVLLFEVVRRRAGDLVGIAAALLLVALGAGSEDLFSAFQISWLGSIAFGLGSLLALPRRPGLAAALVTLSLMCSGIGVPFAAAAVVPLLLTPERRRGLVWFAPVAAAFLVWFVLLGRHGVHPTPGPTLANIYLAIPYTLYGLAQGSAAIVGQGGWFGVDTLVAAVAAVGWRWKQRGVDPFSAGIAAAMVAMYVSTGLTRAQLGYGQASASRYMYIAASLWMLLLADPASALPWRGWWRPALATLVGLACFNSAVLLLQHASPWSDLTRRQVADVQALDAMRLDPCLDPAAFVDPEVMRYGGTPFLFYPAVDRFGDPAAGLAVVDVADYDAGRHRLHRAGC